MTLANVFTKTTRDRWKAPTIGVISLGFLFFFGMTVYRDIDLSVYTNLPDYFRQLFGISEDADVASLAYGAILSGYGALSVTAITLAMGASVFAGEERDRTIGLLLGNPKSRTSVLASKAASMVVLTVAMTLLLWAIGLVTPEILSVSIAGIHVGALMFHLLAISLFFGFLALAIGAWTGSPGVASGATAAVLFVSFMGAGLFPLIEGFENLAKAFPWYYFNASSPETNGIDWGHIGILVAGIVVFAAAAVIGVNRRDLRDQTAGISVVDRLRDHPLTHKVADRLAGSTRVSRIWIKTASEHQGLLLVVALLMFGFMGVLLGPMYLLIDEAMATLTEAFPPELLSLFGGGDMSTPEGWYQIETFGMMAPIAVMVVTIAIGGRALTGEEARNTMGLLLANPIKRSTVLYQKTLTMIIFAFVIGFSTFAGVAVGSLLGNLGMSIGNIAATCLLVTLLGLAYGGLALALGAATGRTRIATFGATGLALIAFVINGLLPFSESLSGLVKWQPFYYYLSSDPLMNGMDWGHGAVLTALFVALVGLSVVLFQRRDLRQVG
ncbi:MAG: ABC transporter permease subunit [Actinomycetota bacterium]